MVKHAWIFAVAALCALGGTDCAAGQIFKSSYESGYAEWDGKISTGTGTVTDSFPLPFSGQLAARHRAGSAAGTSIAYYLPPSSSHIQFGGYMYTDRKISFPRVISKGIHTGGGAFETPWNLSLLQYGAATDAVLRYSCTDDLGVVVTNTVLDTLESKRWYRVDIVLKQAAAGSTWVYVDGANKYISAVTLDTTSVDSVFLGIIATPLFYSDTGNVFFDAVIYDTLPCSPPCGYVERRGNPAAIWAGQEGWYSP